MPIQTLSQFPLRDYTDPLRANPAGTLWAQSPEIPAIDCFVAGDATPRRKEVTGTVTAFDGAAVGWTIAGINYPITGATDAPSFAALWNASAPHRAIAFASVPEAGKVKIQIEGLSNPVVASYNPNAGSFAGLVINQAGSDPKYVAAGTAVVRAAGEGLYGHGVETPGASTTGDQIVGVALRDNLRTDHEIELEGWEPGRGAPPAHHVRVIPGGYPKVLIGAGSPAAEAGGLVYVIKTGLDAGKFRTNAGGSVGSWTATFSAANGTDAVGAYFNGQLVALGVPGYLGSAVDATNATRFAARVNDDPVIGQRFTATALGAVVTLTPKDSLTTWTIVKYKPATSDVTIANPTPQVAPIAVLLPNSRWGKGHAADAPVGYLELKV